MSIYRFLFCDITRAVCQGLVLLLFLTACSHDQSVAKEEKEQFEVHIRSEEDVKKLDQIETILTVTPEKAVNHPDYQVVENIAVPYMPEYKIGANDVVEIVYHIRYDELDKEYVLEIEDKVSVNFPYHPQFSSTVFVRTDGKITLPLIGDVDAAGRTPEKLAEKLNEEYSTLLSNPGITVALEEFNAKIRELKRAITTAPRGQSKIAPVTPDGRISFPIIGTIQAGGMTVSQLEAIVNERYKAYVRNLHATLILLEIHQPKLYVFGEVNAPGAYDMNYDMNLLDALTLAKGHVNSADLNQVVVFRNEGLERPIAFKVDLNSVLKTGNIQANLRLKPADIIFVPKTGLDNFNEMMAKIFTKGIYTILPFSTDYNWNYRIDGRTTLTR